MTKGNLSAVSFWWGSASLGGVLLVVEPKDHLLYYVVDLVVLGAYYWFTRDR